MYIFKRGKKKQKTKALAHSTSYDRCKTISSYLKQKSKGMGEKQLYIKCSVLIVISYKILITLAFYFVIFPGFNLGICRFRHGLFSLGDGRFVAAVP